MSATTGMTLGEVAKALNRSPVYLRGLQTRFVLPVREGAAYTEACVAFLRTVVLLRACGTSEESLLRLWHLEKKLLTLLHADSTGSPTWFLDECGKTTHRKRRLLLSNRDLGVAIPARMLQLGLNFGDALPELFEGREMGEDALRVLETYLAALAALRHDAANELPMLRAATILAKSLAENVATQRRAPR